MEKIFDENTVLKYGEEKHSNQELLLIERISNSDETALSEFYDRYSKLLFSLIIKIVKHNEEAEEVLQSVFIKVWNNAVRFEKTKGNVYTWVTTLARNSAIDRIRSKQYKENISGFMKYREEEKIIKSEEMNGFDLTVSREKTDFVNNALKQIPAAQNIIIELAYFRGMTQSEISGELNIPLGTVKTRMRQALSNLEKILYPLNN